MSRNLEDLSPEELQRFIDSFDVVLSDCDGVLWWPVKPIKGALQALARLQKMGKKVFLVTNNSIPPIKVYQEKLRGTGMELESYNFVKEDYLNWTNMQEQLINPARVIAWYLKKINFQGEAYVLGSPAVCNELKEMGIEVVPHPEVIETNIPATIMGVQDRPSVKAVIADFDVNCNWAKITFAVSCLQRDEVLYINGALDDWIAYDENIKFLGPGPLTGVITKQSGRKPVTCAKPSEMLKDYVYEHCKVVDPHRCLFIGDTIDHDMKFAKLCNFIKLFVESGNDTLDDALKEKETCPDYHITTLGHLNTILDNLTKTNSYNHGKS